MQHETNGHRLQLTEYGEAKPWPTTDEELGELRLAGDQWQRILGLAASPFVIEYSERRRYSVRAEGVTGFLRVGGLFIEIRPKFLDSGEDSTWRRALWQILSAVEDHPRLGDLTTATTEEFRSFPDLMGWILVDALRQAEILGFPRGYIEEVEQLSVLRGRLDLRRISDLLVTPYLLPCIFDVYSEDVSVNRLFHWAARTLEGLVRSPYLSRQLSDLAAVLNQSHEIPPGIIEAEFISLPPMYDYLMPALRVSRMLLRRESLVHEWDEEQASSFLWKSSDVFEKFMKYLLRGVCGQYRGIHLDDAGLTLAKPSLIPGPYARTLKTYPDARICRGDRTVVVLDAKYKALTDKGQPRNEDVYQVMAGGRVSGCDETFLLYPSSTAGPKEPIHWTVSGTGQPRRLTAMFVALLEMGKPLGEQELVRRLSSALHPTLAAPDG